MDADTISKDNCCELGKWLHGEAKSKYGKLASHSECITKHAEFHKEAGKVANTINSKKYTEAEVMLGANKPYASASSAVGMAVLHLKKEAGIY
jgi:methyl-accepting chemotaxis protein